MRNIQVVPDVVVPLVVSGLNIGAGVWDAKASRSYKAQPILGVAGVVIGYGGAIMNKQPEIMKNIAIASMPAAAVGIYEWIRSAMAKTTTTASRGGIAARTISVQADQLLQYKKGGL